MQITRGWHRSIPVFSSPFRAGLSAVLLTGAVLRGASAAPAPEILPAVSPEKSLTGWLLASSVMMQRGEIDAAHETLSHVLALSSQNLKLREDGLRYAAMTGHETEAVALAKTLAASDIATLVLAQNAIPRKAWAEMRQTLSRNSHHGPLVSVAAPVLLAWAQAEEGHIEQALNTLSAAAAFAPTRRLYQLHAALIAERLSSQHEAQSLYQKAGNSPDDPLTLQILYAQLYGGWLEGQGQHQGARDAIAALGVSSPLASMIIGPLHHTLQKRAPLSAAQGAAILNLQLALMITDVIQQEGIPRDPAIITLQQALYLDPNLTVARIFLADTFREGNQLPKGLGVLDHVADTDPLAALAAQERVNLASRSHDLPMQADALNRALTLLPDNPEFLVQLAEVQDQMGHHDEAIELYTKALKASPPRKEIVWPILLGRAMAAQESGNWAVMKEDMHHALELAPDQPEVLNFVGYASIEHDVNQERALQLLKRALDLQPNDPSIQDSYAWALLKHKGDLKTALPILIQAAEHASSDAEIGYHLGVAYWYLGRHTEAQDQWNQSLDDSPQPQDRTLILNALQQGGPHLKAFENNK
ncbi:tetratricopeptide repeat protein [Gluconobacter japonicus]|uniref:tetratricopeptide repeat protein n=1 Tax=Gluconobacter japonicus TaxID=376620 RepID=UPI0039E8DE6E